MNKKFDVYADDCPIDCGDRSCLCASPIQQKSMRTNGGCKCYNYRDVHPIDNIINLKTALEYWKRRALAMEDERNQLQRVIEQVGY